MMQISQNYHYHRTRSWLKLLNSSVVTLKTGLWTFWGSWSCLGLDSHKSWSCHLLELSLSMLSLPGLNTRCFPTLSKQRSIISKFGVLKSDKLIHLNWYLKHPHFHALIWECYQDTPGLSRLLGLGCNCWCYRVLASQNLVFNSVGQ